MYDNTKFRITFTSNSIDIVLSSLGHFSGQTLKLNDVAYHVSIDDTM